MLKFYAEFIELLHQELLLYGSLTELIRREQLLIQSFDSNSLMQTISQKDLLNLQIQTLETRRIEITANLASQVGCLPGQLNISRLLPHLEAEEQRSLTQLRDNLMESIATAQNEARALESQYKATIGIFENTMRYIVAELSDSQPNKGYNRKGQTRSAQKTTHSVIVSTQA